MDKVKLSPKAIVSKRFKSKVRGYDPAEVDEFLDIVIQDYGLYAKNTQQLEMENDRLRSKVDELTKQVAVGKSGQASRPANNMTNMDILKRLSNLERHVFGTQLNNDDDQSNRF
ncbi:cell division regulator GpsB [Ligilactobacillus saerimneri]|uniref:Cell division protein GpsB n=2 Tax=Ligilactobacillus saerimneri TaxID=228229 RepID=M5J5R2_9LACO|nr:cell division regulator GpsB [Ligilactobacillus saerimneri]EKW98495.1 cell division protein GpsB [Ligilactobacillus saerimneri 30a]KRL74449.1 cell division protein GpsB [Ligilactobacillus saerimneri DSM 16049]MBU5309160.1 cell division regulator GpsB [Ligilactobacillus saerimneri]MCZ0891785.1 cell division regulator GpsB [Ligilactobacillus saerimneri]MDI9205792.1 cell division regulator GpsB [Ligilactobacillus saerimneri]